MKPFHRIPSLPLCSALVALACAACSTPAVQEGAAPPPAPTKAEAPATPAKPPPAVVAKPPSPPPAGKPDARAPGSKGADALAKGVRAYEDGDYRAAERELTAALEAGLAPAEQAQARKYLAFLTCTSRRITACRQHFRKAFEADPSFELTAAEAGHPTWGPVYRKVKADVAGPAKRR